MGVEADLPQEGVKSGKSDFRHQHWKGGSGGYSSLRKIQETVAMQELLLWKSLQNMHFCFALDDPMFFS